MIRVFTLATLAMTGPALAAGDYPFFSLRNTDMVVLLGFIVFAGILVYFKVPAKIMGLLDARGVAIQAELDEARRLREEALALHADFERKQAEVKTEADRIVEKAKADAQIAANQAKADIEASITRRLKTAEDQIQSAEVSAIREVRNTAVNVAIAAAGDVLAKQMDAERSDALIQQAIATTQDRLH